MAKLRKTCEVCTPKCIRSCPIVEQRERFHKMTRCPACGARMPVSAEACPECGEGVDSVCPECLGVNTFVDGTCTACGYTPRRVDLGPSQWYRYESPDLVGKLAPPPGVG